jgi:hypothetical protein
VAWGDIKGREMTQMHADETKGLSGHYAASLKLTLVIYQAIMSQSLKPTLVICLAIMLKTLKLTLLIYQAIMVQSLKLTLVISRSLWQSP